jgi:hypothetical protein
MNSKTVGTCPLCGRKIVKFNNVPLTAFCWGPVTKPHKEWRKVLSKAS